MTQPSAKVILDSTSPEGDRLVTFEGVMHRFVLAEFNTHRQFCLAGDAVLEFDLPSSGIGGRRAHQITIADFVDRWHNGAARLASNPKRPLELTLLQDDTEYSAADISSIIGYSKSAIHLACRTGALAGKKLLDGTWVVTGGQFKTWRAQKPQHTRFPIRERLAGMNIRQLDEDTGAISTSHVVACWPSGRKPVYTVNSDLFQVSGSADHLIHTPTGYVRIGDLQPGDRFTVRKFGLPVDEHSKGFSRVDGAYRCAWQRIQKQRLTDQYPGCQRCGGSAGLQVHHIIPVHQDPTMTFDESNVELVCNDCHRESHDKQGWQAHQYLYGDVAQVSSVTFRGVEETYDLEIEGAYPNFVANGVVVHNSRNSASSRAIPVKKQIERVMSDPAMPVEWGLNQPGMQSGQLADYATVTRAKSAWLFSRDKAVSAVIELDELGIHKQWASRLLEPFMWHTVVFTTTVPGLENFFLQRCTVHSPLAQPEMRAFADAVLGAYFVSTPTPVGLGEWHTPYIQEDEEFSIELERLQVSAARCARVSYLTQDGVRDHKEDLKLFDRLVSAKPMHGSPLEHVAIPAHPTGQHRGNLEGWDQLRHILGA